MSFEQIRETDPEAADLLCLMSMFDNQAIPGLIICENREPLVFWEVAQPLIDFSLIKVQNTSHLDQAVEERLFDMHSLVQLATRDWLEVRERQGKELYKWERKSVHIMATIFPDDEFAHQKSMKSCHNLLPHASRTLEYTPRGRNASLDRATIADKVGWYLQHSGQYARAEGVSEGAYAARNNLLGASSIDTIESMGLFSLVLRSQGNLQRARSLQEKALKELERLFPHGNVRVAQACAALGSIYIAQARFLEAEAQLRHSVSMFVPRLGPQHLATLGAISQLAVALEKQRRFSEAEELHRLAISGGEASLGDRHPDTITFLSNLAMLLSSQKRFSEAEQLYRQVTEANEDVHGPEHPYTITTLSQVGLNLWYQDKNEEAEALLRHALGVEERTLGAEHPSAYMGAYNLALVLQDLHKHAEAEALFVRAIKGTARALGTEHPDLLCFIRNFASLLRQEGKHNEATILRQAHDDPSTLGDADQLCSLIDSLALGEDREDDG